MARILLKGAEVVATLDAPRTEYRNGWVVVDGSRIDAVGEGDGPVEDTVDRVINCRGQVVMPGLVNCHHHMYQSLFRCVPHAQDMELFDWLRYLYEMWQWIDEEAVFVSTVTSLVELLLSGCTTTTDHLYLYPRRVGSLFDVQVEASRLVGLRFVACRGSMSLSREDGGLPPSSVVQNREDILADSERVLLKYHDRSPASMLRVALAPCSPFSVDTRLMEDSATLAREHGALLHTHLAETLDEIEYCRDRFGCSPLHLLERVGWLADDVWVAHMVHASTEEIRRLSESGVGVAHCPSSNMITGAGIAPVARMLESGVRVGIGVDGSAANDMGSVLREAREAMLLARLDGGASSMSSRSALELASLGGARVLRRDDAIGSLEPGKCADIVAYDVSGVSCAGAHDLVAALTRCDVTRASLVIVNGEVLVEEGALTRPELEREVGRHRIVASRLQSVSRRHDSSSPGR